jgi:hypothetical protein
MDLSIDDRTWASDQLAAAEFGDVRRHARAELMLRRAVANPCGRLTDVFEVSAELQGAYDFVRGSTPPAAIIGAIASATCTAVANIGANRVFAIIDGTSLSLTDRVGNKRFGSVGARGLPTRGLKVVDTLVVSTDGVPIGLLDLQWWARGKKSTQSRYVRRRNQATEVRHWVDAIRIGAQRLRDGVEACRAVIVIDREGDCAEMLRAIAEEKSSYIVRAAQDRPIVRSKGQRSTLRKHLACQPVAGVRRVHVPAGHKRTARTADLAVRTARVVLDLPNRTHGGRIEFETNVVWATERRAPRGEKKLDWMLLTDQPIDRFNAAEAVLDGYCLRWRIEDFHKAWKSGRCNVEETQLRDREHVIRWATLLATVAVRIEQLKHLARTTPDLPASTVFDAIEIEALKAAKIRQKKRTEVIPEGMPTIGQAVRWIGDLGGYQGRSGIPGSLTLGRGLERFSAWAEGFAAAYALRPKSQRK